MAEDILPPAPPGEERPIQREEKKKGGFLNGLFKKKKEEYEEPIIPIPPKSEPAKITPKPEIPQDINLDDIRKQLGLQPDFQEEAPEISQPPKIIKLEEEKPAPKPATGIERHLFELPDIDEPPRLDAKPKPALEEDLLKEPPKMSPGGWTSDLEKEKDVLGFSDFDSDFIKDVDKQGTGKTSEFTQEALKKEEPAKPGGENFLTDISPKEVKAFAKGMKRKKFEQEKGISYEPEVNLEQPDIIEEAREEEELLEESPEEEIRELKAKLRDELFRSHKKKLEEEEDKKAGPPIPPAPPLPPPAQQSIMPQKPAAPSLPPEQLQEEIETPKPLTTEPDFLPEEFPQSKEDISQILEPPPDEPEKSLEEQKPDKKKEKERKKELKKEEKEKKKEESIDSSRPIVEIEKEFREKITGQIREEEKAKLEKNYEELRKALEKQKEMIEQEKIMVAGKVSKYEFKEKQLRKEKSGFADEKENFSNEKKEAVELLRKLPSLREDHDKLQGRMIEIYERLKEYNHKEDGLLQIEKNIIEKEKALGQAQKRLEEMEEKIREKGFADYLEAEVKNQHLISPQFEEKDLLKDADIGLYNLIDECKSLIINRNIIEAKNIYMQLRDAYTTIKVEGAEKDLLYTTIRELYDDIKLAEMEHPF